MEQHQFKMSLSVGTKLLISVILLLFVVIAFLNISTIMLVTEDKRAYTYQAQSTEAVLLSREFMNSAKRALDTLRLGLSSFDPLQPIRSQQKANLDSVLNNQAEVLLFRAELVNTTTGAAKTLTTSVKAEALKKLELSPEDLKISEEQMKIALPQLLSSSFSLLNVSKVDHPPLVAVLLADIKFKAHTEGMLVAVAFLSLKDFGTEARGSHLTIADREGWVLYDNDISSFFNKKNIVDDPLFATAIANQITTGAQEYEHGGVKYLGSFVRPGLDLIVLTRTEWRKAMRATYLLAERYVLLAIMATAAAVIFAIVFSKTMTAPLNHLYQATKEVAAGNFDIQLKIKSRDEIGALTSSFMLMSKKIQELILESIRKVHLENELAIASTVQQTLIPPSKFQNDSITIHSLYKSADQCGGDWWGFFGAQDKLCIMIADATGHGLPCALITASARSCVSMLQKQAEEDPNFNFSPGSMLSYANRVVYDASSGKIMMTFFAGVVDFTNKTFTYANAGHNPPWLFREENGKFALKSLMSSGQRLGEAIEAPPFEEKTVAIAEGDLLFLYTDGLLEGTNITGDMYGKTRTRKNVERGLSSGPESMIDGLIKDFMTHNGTKPLDDDVTMAIAKILKTGPVGSA